VDRTPPLLDTAAREQLIAGLTSASDGGYLEWLVTFLREVTGVAFAFVGELIGEDEDRVRTIALATPEGLADNFEYDLLYTPCATVIIAESAACVYPCEVAPQFPKDLLLVDMGIEAYLGVALYGGSGRRVGLIVLLDTKPFAAEMVDPAQALLFAFQARTTEVIIARRTLRDLRNFEAQLDSIGVGDVPGEVARVTTGALAQALGVRLAFVARFVDAERTRLRSLAVHVDGQRAPPFEFELAGSPCELLGEDRLVVVSEGASERFPAAAFLREHQAQAFLARALDDVSGVPLGVFGVVHDRPLDRPTADHPVFKLVAQRVAFELQRLDAVEQRRAAERRLLESQRIESLGLLAGGVAHDFNNLLVGVLGNAELALASLAPDSPARAHLEDIVDSADQAARLCNQMLAYAGRTALEAARIELGPLVEDAAGLLRVSIPKHCELRLRLAAEPIWIEGDSTQLTQILMNLITNAADAIGERPGFINIHTSVRAFADDELAEYLGHPGLASGEYASLRVDDSGCGMSEEVRARVFDPFFTTKPSGHGLGLAAMLGIIARHRGGVRVQSELGRGTSFQLCFPIATGEREQVVDAKAVAPAASGRARVLLVDDEERVRRVVTAMLETAGHEVLLAGDGVEALELFAAQREPIAVVLLDLSMPRLGGVETLRRLRERDPMVKVILSSGLDELDELGDGPQPDAIVHKPYRMQTLLTAIAELI
jgi:two-component system, cell cycle sensor histidine kinase and response regulator CckA